MSTRIYGSNSILRVVFVGVFDFNMQAHSKIFSTRETAVNG